MERLSEKHDIILYRISLRQDEQGRQSNLVRIGDLEDNEVYRSLIEKEYLTYEQHGEGKTAIANLIVTLKGMRYCYEFLDEIAELDRHSRQQF